MTNKEIKRLLALLKSEVDLSRDHHLDLPDGFKESFENQAAFRGWVNYHVTWDVASDDAWKVVPLKEPLVRTWNRELMKRVPVITSDGEIIDPLKEQDGREGDI